MNRESVNTLLLIGCLGSVVYVGFLVSQKPSLDEIDSHVDTIVESRQTVQRAFEMSRLERCIRETLGEHTTAEHEQLIADDALDPAVSGGP